LGLLHPKRIVSLQLVSTSSRVPPEGAVMWDERIKAVREKGMGSQPERSMQRWVSEAGRKNAALVARLSKLIETTPADGFIGWGGAIRGLHISDRPQAL